MDQAANKTPANQAKLTPGRGGIVPPVETRWRPGQSGNPRGRQTAGASIKEWLNQMREWDAARIRAVLTDESAPIAKVAAARIWVDAASTSSNASGNPIAGPEVDRICDRTDGKPTQAVELTGNNGGPVQVAQYDLSKLAREEKLALRECLVKASNGDAADN